MIRVSFIWLTIRCFIQGLLRYHNSRKLIMMAWLALQRFILIIMHLICLLSQWLWRSSGAWASLDCLIATWWGLQPMRGCGHVGKVRVCVGFGTKLIFILVWEYEVYYLTKVEIVGSGTFQEQRKEGVDWKSRERLGTQFQSTRALKLWKIMARWSTHNAVMQEVFHVFMLFFISLFTVSSL